MIGAFLALVALATILVLALCSAGHSDEDAVRDAHLRDLEDLWRRS